MHFFPTVTTRASQPSDGDLLEEKAIPEVGRSNEWVSPHLTPHSLPGMLRWRKVTFLLGAFLSSVWSLPWESQLGPA